MADWVCPSSTPGLKPDVEVTITLSMSTKGNVPSGPLPGTGSVAVDESRLGGGERCDLGEGAIAVHGIGVQLHPGEGHVLARVRHPHEAERLDPREHRELGGLHVVKRREVPEPGQGHDEGPPLGGTERAEIRSHEQDLGFSVRPQRGLAVQRRWAPTSGKVAVTPTESKTAAGTWSRAEITAPEVGTRCTTPGDAGGPVRA